MVVILTFLGLSHQVADFFQKGLVGRHVGDGAGVGGVPGVQLGLQAVALGQQGDVLGGQVGHDGVKTVPEGVGRNAGAGQHFVFNKAVQDGGHLQAGARWCGGWKRWTWGCLSKMGYRSQG